MGRTHDVLIVGAGHNMLTAAGYLAKAGLDVGVFEARDYIGGGAQTHELMPGFKMETDAVAHGLIQVNPLLRRDELQLFSKYGLEYLYPESVTSNMFTDGEDFMIFSGVPETCQSIAKISEHDAEQYEKFINFSKGILEFLQNSLFAPPSPFGATWAMLDSSKEGRDIMRLMMSSPMDMVDEWFTDEHVKIAVLKTANEAMSFPWARDSGIAVFTMCAITHIHPYGTPKGGGRELSNALVRSIEDRGGTIYMNSPVTRIVVENGKAVGLIANGEEYRCKKAILCGASPLDIFVDGGLLGDETPQDIKERIVKLRDDDHSTVVSNYALNERPRYNAKNMGSQADDCILVELLPMMEEFLEHYVDCMIGRPPKSHCLYVANHDFIDPTKSPAGKANVQIYDPAPYWLKDGGPQRWDEIKEAYEDSKLEWVRRWAVNMGDENIIARWVNSPLDLERRSPNYHHGNISTLGRGFTQLNANRPIPELGQYRVPWAKGMYIGGPGSHPGGGVGGGARAVAIRMIDDFGMDFEDVVEGKYNK